MRRFSQALKVLFATGIAVIGLAAMSASPAHAASGFFVCGPQTTCSMAYTTGTITWHNRTATVTGSVIDVGPGNTTAHFEAYAGTTKIDSDARTANDESSLGSRRDFSFGIGDPNLVGGINRIKVTVCFNLNDIRSCSTPVNYSR